MQSQEKNVEVDTRSILAFIKILTDHLSRRFPDNEIQDWVALDITALTNCNFNFGTEHVAKLATKYKDLIGEKSESIVAQYNDFKFIVCEKIKSKVITNFPTLVEFALAEEQFQNLAQLIDICGTFLTSSVDCEHGFSLMNSIKTKQRNRLEDVHLDMLMRIKSFINDGGQMDLNAIYSEWAGIEDRREKL